jgi:malonate-semialdehyde dehydrogenase (acetylating)/methylmalonate-semialdehyde dehydrogenase
MRSSASRAAARALLRAVLARGGAATSTAARVPLPAAAAAGLVAAASQQGRTTTTTAAAAASLPTVPLLIDGQLVESKASEWVTVHDPATQKPLSRVPLTTPGEFEAAVASAKAAFPAWRDTPVSQRQRVLFRLHALVRDRTDALAEAITREQGKTLADARGDVFRGLEVVEASCAAGFLAQGEALDAVASGPVDCRAVREPLGVAAGVCPFNFPAMVPLWMFPLAVAAGNTFLLKPSERVPGAAVLLARYALEAGLPPGVLNVVHGGRGAVDAVCDHPDVASVSFVGSDRVGRHVYARAAAAGKRVQANLGAKNHAVILGDADPALAASAVAGASFGAAGQRCMAVSVAVVVGGEAEARRFRERIVAAGAGLKVGPGSDAGTDVGPMITPQARDRAVEIVTRSAAMPGAELWLDGRGQRPAGAEYDAGNWLGPTVVALDAAAAAAAAAAGGGGGSEERLQLHSALSAFPVYSEEVFGPVLTVVRVDTLEQAIALLNANAHGNGAAVFTRDGGAARRFCREVRVGMVGVNVPIPVPLPFFSFTGWRGSMAGDLHMYGRAGMQFFTQPKTITTRWDWDGGKDGARLLINGGGGAGGAGGAGSGGRLPGLDRVGA